MSVRPPGAFVTAAAAFVTPGVRPAPPPGRLPRAFPVRAMSNFSQRHCQAHGLQPAQYARDVLRRTLHPPALVLYRPISWVLPDFFAADRELVNSAAWLVRESDLDLDLAEYRYHPGNQSALRRALGLCISTGRLRRLVRTAFATNRMPAAARPAEPGAHAAST